MNKQINGWNLENNKKCTCIYKGIHCIFHNKCVWISEGITHLLHFFFPDLILDLMFLCSKVSSWGYKVKLQHEKKSSKVCSKCHPWIWSDQWFIPFLHISAFILHMPHERCTNHTRKIIYNITIGPMCSYYFNYPTFGLNTPCNKDIGALSFIVHLSYYCHALCCKCCPLHLSSTLCTIFSPQGLRL